MFNAYFGILLRKKGEISLSAIDQNSGERRFDWWGRVGYCWWENWLRESIKTFSGGGEGGV
jgi:hypothetical protein